MHNNTFPNITLGLQHGSYNTPARDYRPIGDAREIETVDRNPYKYKYNSKEWQDELGLNVTAMDFRQYDNALGRFLNPDALSELAPMHTSYRFGFNNPVYWRDPTGLFENEKFEFCPTCPTTPEFQPSIDDPINTFDYDPETNTVNEIILLDDVIATSSKKEIKTLDYLAYANEGISVFAGGLWNTKNRGGSFRTFKKKGEFAPKYYPDNRFGSGKSSKHVVYNVSKTMGRGTIRKEIGSRPNGFSEGSIIYRAKFDRQVNRAKRKANRIKN